MNLFDSTSKQDFRDIHTIGIPRALLYYRYHILWKTFFEEMGRTVVISGPTDRAILENGEKRSIDECCLASKLYMGHVENLMGKCDAIFVPSIDNMGLHKGFCTKFQALPDLVSNTFADKDLRLISCEIDKEDTGISAEEGYISIACAFGYPKKQAKIIYQNALQAQKDHDKEMNKQQSDLLKQVERSKKGDRPLRILLASHPYVIHDPYIGGPIVDMLSDLDTCVLYSDRFDRKRAYEKSFEFSDTMPWIVNREIIGTILHLYDHLDGIVLISAFPCGPDSMTNDSLIRCIKGKPILSLTVDAQSGTAGLETRLESFVDILHYQARGGYLNE